MLLIINLLINIWILYFVCFHFVLRYFFFFFLLLVSIYLQNYNISTTFFIKAVIREINVANVMLSSGLDDGAATAPTTLASQGVSGDTIIKNQKEIDII